MPASISLYIYRVRIFENHGRIQVPFDDKRLTSKFSKFLEDFVVNNNAISQDHDRQRTWFFDPPERNSNAEIAGLLRYGVFGFESELFDTKTRRKQYDRKTTDFEQIPLYYQFWTPDGCDYSLLAFQSFSGRSCISYVQTALREQFQRQHKEFSLRFDRVTPQQVVKASFDDAKLKQVRLVKKSASSDLADLSGAASKAKEVEVEVRITAVSGNFGKFGALKRDALEKGVGVLSTTIEPFEKATAKVIMNGKERTIGVFGNTGNSGAFDVSEDAELADDGHPLFASVDEIANGILRDVCEVV